MELAAQDAELDARVASALLASQPLAHWQRDASRTGPADAFRPETHSSGSDGAGEEHPESAAAAVADGSGPGAKPLSRGWKVVQAHVYGRALPDCRPGRLQQFVLPRVTLIKLRELQIAVVLELAVMMNYGAVASRMSEDGGALAASLRLIVGRVRDEFFTTVFDMVGRVSTCRRPGMLFS